MTKIAVIQTAFPGDVILSLPLFQALKDLDSACHLTAMVRPESACLIKNNPYIDEIIPFDKHGADKGFKGIIKMASKLKGYDKAILVQRHFRSAFIPILARVPERIGYNISIAHLLYTKRVIYRGNVHEVQRCLDLIGINNKKYRPKIYLDEEILGDANRRLDDNEITGGFVAVAPGSVWFTKRYVHFPELIDLIHDRFNLPVVLLGGMGDRDLCQSITSACSYPPIDLSGKTDLLLSAAIISIASLIIANDSAPGHIAAAVNTPVVSIFGSTVPAFGFAPYSDKSAMVEMEGLYCRPCSHHGSERCPQKHFRCMNELLPEKIIAAARLLLPR